MKITETIKYLIKNNNILYQIAKIVYNIPTIPYKVLTIITYDTKSIKILGITNTIALCAFKIASFLVFDNLRHKLIDKKHRIISDFLERKYMIVSQENVPQIHENPYQQKIWVCWLQGEDNAPEIIKICLKQIRVHANEHEVILIDLNNYHNFVDVPEEIYIKYKSGVILPAHFSDYIRYQLLYRYGGAWLDATLFVTQDIGRNHEFDYDLYSAHYKVPQDDNCIARSRWVTPLFFCKAGNGFIYNTYKIFEKYHLKYNHSIDYLLIDYIMDFAVRSNKLYADMVNTIPTNNDDFQKIYRSYSLPYSKELFQEFLNSSTYFYKLTYKNVPSQYKNGHLTVYGHIIQNYLQ